MGNIIQRAIAADMVAVEVLSWEINSTQDDKRSNVYLSMLIAKVLFKRDFLER